MARQTRPLTNNEVKAAKADKKPLVLYDGEGLELLIKPDVNSKLWRFRYYKPVTKKRGMISLGAYPSISLAEARRLKGEARALLAQGIDPLQQRNNRQAALLEEHKNTFRNIAALWFEFKKTKGLAEGTLQRTWNSLENYVFPAIGNRPITSLGSRDFIELLNPISARGKADTVKRVTQRINEVMDYAINTGIIDANPAAKVNKVFSPPIQRNMPTIRPEELPDLMQALSIACIERQTRLVIEWQLLTICRPGEAAGTRWDELDLEAKEWRMPAGRIKQRREHVIPLSNQALAILEAMRPISGHKEYVFPHNSAPARPMNEQTANMALKRMGYGGKLVAHGLRSIASTAMNEEGFPSDVIEAALSHIDKNEVRRAYNRSTYLEQRRPLMAWWGDFVEQAATGSLSAACGIRGLKIV